MLVRQLPMCAQHDMLTLQSSPAFKCGLLLLLFPTTGNVWQQKSKLVLHMGGDDTQPTEKMARVATFSREKSGKGVTRLFPRVGRPEPSGGWVPEKQGVCYCTGSWIPLFSIGWKPHLAPRNPLSKAFQPAVAQQTKS